MSDLQQNANILRDKSARTERNGNNRKTCDGEKENNAENKVKIKDARKEK